MESEAVALAQTWRTTHGDVSDEEWDLIADLVAPYWKPGGMGRPVEVDRRSIVNAVFYVADKDASDEQILVLAAAYASTEREQLSPTFRLGQSLIGQCAKCRGAGYWIR